MGSGNQEQALSASPACQFLKFPFLRVPSAFGIKGIVAIWLTTHFGACDY
jgi:hypothetical protein